MFAFIAGPILIGVIPPVILLLVRSAWMVSDITGAGSSIFSAEWGATAFKYRGQNGTRHVYECPADGRANSVWGSGPYTDDSSVCTAAVHAGVITFEQGGTVEIEIRPGQSSYQASTAHSVAAGAWGLFDGSFVVVGADDSAATPDPGVQSVTWSESPRAFRGSNGKQVTFRCPPGGRPKSVWGSGPYTDDSSVCTAGVHAGVITFAQGGTVQTEIRTGQSSYRASTAHGVTTGAWGGFDGSFVVQAPDASGKPR